MSRIASAAAQPIAASVRPSRTVTAYAIFVVAAVLLVLPAALGPMMLHDSLAISWVWADQFTTELARGNPYPRWLPLANGGLGAPAFYFYPPVAFYTAAAFGLSGLDTYTSLIATFAAAFAVSGVTMWHWLRDSARYPLIGALLFMAAPYHLLDFTRRGALAESVAIALIPLVALGLRRIAEGRGPVLAAVAYGALICTHLPLALLTSVLLIAPYSLKHGRRLLVFAAAIALGIGLAAIYLVPALSLGEHRDAAMLYRAPYLQPSYWLLANADFSDGFVRSLFLIMAAIAAASLILIVKHRDPWALGALAIVILCAGLVPSFWSLPLLGKVQFPYRALPLAEFMLVTAVASREIRVTAIAALIPLALLSGSLIGRPSASDQPRLELLQAQHPDVYENLPQGVVQLDDMQSKLDDILRDRLPPPVVPGKIVKPQFYFPSWSCGTRHRETKLLMHGPECNPRIVWTREEWVGACLTLLSLVLIGALTRKRRLLPAAAAIGARATLARFARF